MLNSGAWGSLSTVSHAEVRELSSLLLWTSPFPTEEGVWKSPENASEVVRLGWGWEEGTGGAEAADPMGSGVWTS